MAEHGAAEGEGTKPPKKKGKLLLIAIPVLLIAVGAGLWFTGILPGLLGMNKKPPAKPTDSKPPIAASAPPAYVDLPAIIANLNVPGRRPSYLKLHAKLEIARADEAAVTAAMPRIMDLFQTYLRDMRPEELRGSEGSYRLREELIARATIAAAPAHITDVLFVEMIVE
jgi:flagellar FliL protein